MPSLHPLCAEAMAFIVQARRGAPSDHQFNQLAFRLFEFQFERNAPYRAFCERLGRRPGVVSDYREIPAMVTSAFKEFDMTVLAPEERKTVFISSGTTQSKRGRHFHNEQTLAVYERSLLESFKPYVLPDRPGASFLVLTPPGASAPNSSLVHMFETAGKAFAAPGGLVFAAAAGVDGAWEINFPAVREFSAQAMGNGGPVLICGTAFSFVHLCDELEARGGKLEFPPGSRVFETGGYKGRSRTVPKEELHASIERALGIPSAFIVSEYGMSELSSQAYDRAAGREEPRVFRFPPWVRWNIISPETGQPVPEGAAGLVRIWDLANVGSVLAIQTEDIAIRQGDGFKLAGRAAAAEARGCSLMHL